MGDCLFKRTENVTLPTLPAPPVRRNPRSTGRGATLPSQQDAYNQAQRGARVGAGCGRSQAYNLSAEEAEA